MASLTLPATDGRLEQYIPGSPSPFSLTHTTEYPRIVYAAAHVAADPIGLTDPLQRPAIDWDATLSFRRHLWGLGFKIAEAMDTSQRGLGLDWKGASELIARSLAEARAMPDADLACGAGTDHLDGSREHTLAEIVTAYEDQIAHIEAHGGRAILMASRALCRAARSADDYIAVYEGLVRQTRDKVILHWLGEAFDSQLRGYWGSTDVATAMATVLTLIRDSADKIDGVKISLLHADYEVEMRRLLPSGVAMYTGDDFNYAELMAGDGTQKSHGLLGIFDPIAPAAAAAFDRLAAGDLAGYHDILAPTVALSRCLFEAPTQYYKSGVVFLAWLNGFQNHFRMLGGLESARGILHYADLFRLADKAGLLIDPEKATHRMRALCSLSGVS